jgi:N-acetylneuraminic acid mutarotase
VRRQSCQLVVLVSLLCSSVAGCALVDAMGGAGDDDYDDADVAVVADAVVADAVVADAVVADAVVADADTLGSWAEKQPMSLARHAGAVGVVGAGIVYAGGYNFDAGGHQVAVELYDPGGDVWTGKLQQPGTKTSAAVAVREGMLYLFGGTNSSVNVATVWSFDAQHNVWSTALEPMPSARSGAAAALIDGVIHVVGGHDDAGALDSMLIYAPLGNSWDTDNPSMSVLRTGLGAAVLDEKLYVIGGRQASAGLNLVEVYDPAQGNWSTLEPIPTARVYAGVGVVDGRLYVIGGVPEEGGEALATVESYDPATGEWSSHADMPTARAWPAIAVFDGGIYAIGGHSGGAEGVSLSTLEVFTPPAP